MATEADNSNMNPWVYDITLWLLSILLDLFFREVHPRSSWKIPKSGPVIFVAAPHANQFVDPLILFRVIRNEAKRRVAFLIAAKSLKRKWVGLFSRQMGSVGVGRALDETKPAKGRVFLPDPEGEPTLLKGLDTNFKSEDFQVGGLVVLPSVKNVAANSEISEIMSATELRLKKPFKGSVALKQLTGRNADDLDEKSEEQIAAGRNEQGTKYKVAPKIDQTAVYDSVFARLKKGGCVGIFPEGGSHDRTELLPLKAGVAIMALGALANDPDCDLKIVPCGMNYFHAHKFRSRAVVEFGTPLEVPPELVEAYKNGDRRKAVGEMLEIIYNALVAVTVTSPDYDTLMLIQAVRRLYNPQNKPLPLPMVVELNRRLVKGYTRYKDDPRVVSLKKNVIDYHRQLMALNVRDHQLQYAKFSIIQVTGMLLYRITKLLLLSAGVLPGLVLFAPVFVVGKLISIRKAKEALAASTVKIQARDVVATWKLLVAMALAPTLYTFYTVALTAWTYYNRVGGRVPDGVPLWTIVIFGYVFFPTITYAALRFGEVGMDILKSLRPLVLALNPSSGNTLVRLRVKREELSKEVTQLINELGPEMFPDFDAQRIMHSSGSRQYKDSDRTEPATPEQTRGRDSFFTVRTTEDSPSSPRGNGAAGIGGGSSSAGHIPRNESFRNLGSIGLFSSHPHTPTSQDSRSRDQSRPGSSHGHGGFFGSMGFTSLNGNSNGFTSGTDVRGGGAANGQLDLDDVSKKIRGAMQERGKRRKNESIDDDSEDAGSDVSTPASSVGGEGFEMKKHR